MPRHISTFDISLPFRHPKALLVEGVDEGYLLINGLLDHLGLDDVDVRSYGGTDNLSDTLFSLKEGAATGFDVVQTLGIWRDADTDPGAALQSVQGALRDHGFAAPTQSGDFADGSPRVGVLILPPDGTRGSLETVCLASARGIKQVKNCIEGYVECLALAEAGLHPNLEKVRLHTYLASRREPGLKLGEAAKAGCWDFSHEAWSAVETFIKAM